jgi:hypothetical protein
VTSGKISCTLRVISFPLNYSFKTSLIPGRE